MSQKACLEKITQIESVQHSTPMPLYSTVVKWLLFRQPLPQSCRLTLAEKAQAWKEISEQSILDVQRQYIQKFIRFCFVRDVELETTKAQLYHHMSVSYLNVVTSDLPSSRKWFLHLYDRVVDDGLQSCSASEEDDDELLEWPTSPNSNPPLDQQILQDISQPQQQVKPAIKKPMQDLEVVSNEREKKKVTFSEELKSYEIEADPISEDALLECLSPSGNPSTQATQRAVQLMSSNATTLEGQLSLLSTHINTLQQDSKQSTMGASNDWNQMKQEDVELANKLDQIVERDEYRNDFNLKSIVDNVKKSYWLVSHQLDQEIETRQAEEKKDSLVTKRLSWAALIKYIIVLLLSSSLFLSSFMKFVKRLHV